MPVAAVMASGCGHRDGVEINEAVLTALALSERGVTVRWFAPDADHPVMDHLTRTPQPGEQRNMLREAARIARGRIAPLTALRAADAACLVIPGGSGTGRNLFTFKRDGAQCRIDPAVEAVLAAAVELRRPILAAGIAAALPAVFLARRGRQPTVTLGPQLDKIRHIETAGARHAPSPVDGCVVDEANRLITTPAFLYRNPAPELCEIMRGIRAAVDRLCAWLTPVDA